MHSSVTQSTNSTYHTTVHHCHLRNHPVCRISIGQVDILNYYIGSNLEHMLVEQSSLRERNIHSHFSSCYVKVSQNAIILQGNSIISTTLPGKALREGYIPLSGVPANHYPIYCKDYLLQASCSSERSPQSLSPSHTHFFGIHFEF